MSGQKTEALELKNNESKAGSPSGSTAIEPFKDGVTTPDTAVNFSSVLQQEIQSSPSSSPFK